MTAVVGVAVPPGTVAVVLLSWTGDGALAASFAESRTSVPPTRALIVDALLGLAVALDDQRQELDAASMGERHV